jgi:3-oxoacyl-[acyl-carrier protein] reductase
MSTAPRTRTVLISGGSRGLGAALIAEFWHLGCNVATFSRSTSPFIEAHLGEASFYWCAIDARDHDKVRDFVNATARKFAGIDVLINNTGIASDGVLPLMRGDAIVDMIDTNLTAAVLLAQACSRIMLRQTSGCIVNISSVNAIRGHEGVSVYSATKAALDGFTRSLARELGPRGIRVNSVAPGFFETDLTRGMDQAAKDRIARRTPLRRVACIEEIVAAVTFLASDQASFVTGQTLVVDGGITC